MRCECKKEIRAEAQFFELGMILGRFLNYLKPPVFDQCFAIAIPEQQGNSKITTRKDQTYSLGNEADQSLFTSLEQLKQQYESDIQRLNQAYHGQLQKLQQSSQSMTPQQCQETRMSIENQYNHHQQELQNLYEPQLYRIKEKISNSRNNQISRSSYSHSHDVNDSENIVTGDLDRLKATIESLNFYGTYAFRLDAAIQKMCVELKREMNKRWSAYIYLNHFKQVEEIEQASKTRSRARAAYSKA